MLTVGVDLAAEAADTAVAWLEWSRTGARVSRLVTRAGDELVAEAVLAADKAGIDCPLGWPDKFVDFLLAQREGLPLPSGAGRLWRRDLANRVTDLVVRDLTGQRPLSVAADRIGYVAMRWAGLAAELARRGQVVDRRGSGVVVEVYPAASLKWWGLPFTGYKRAANLAELNRLVDALHRPAPWLDLGEFESVCRASDDALDAVVAALTARAAALDLVTVPSPGQLESARTEGWIAIPTTPLAELMSHSEGGPRPGEHG
ncbi:hypothetical protein Aph01nite_80670 [Acrocarpospora phusangensis]|uniref:DUF429 domain-containing protein n=1 Tax=Acrocarpospora phusangensis TaxID=1070424 RepID=A0A919QPA5_9ACTN|nr:DUF429 domain-containing protein [Acrocarpospora phusangensis]GIH29757.1 hypothetical protein Aph01nite_80670 [Acrocarpospora phusangensis]